MGEGQAANTEVSRLGKAYRAFEAGNYRAALAQAKRIRRQRLRNDDYALYILAQSAYLTGDMKGAMTAFQGLRKHGGSRFRAVAPWRVADCLWQMKRYQTAQTAYRRLVNQAPQRSPGDLGLARFRIGEALRRAGKTNKAIAAFRRFLRNHPAHPLTQRADLALVRLGGVRGAQLNHVDRLVRAKRLTVAHKWHESIAELSLLDDALPARVRLQRDYDYAMTLFKMRHRYGDAGKILLRIYHRLGPSAAKALFHGARAKSRADHDKVAIRYYLKLVRLYPSSPYAPQAQFLAGWLEFNLGNYRLALPLLRKMLSTYAKSRWANEGLWFLGLSHFLLGQYKQAAARFSVLSGRTGRLVGGKGLYWKGRALHKQGKHRAAIAVYRKTVRRYPFAWYALLARARATELGTKIPVFGGRSRAGRVRAIAKRPPTRTRLDGAIRDADELLAAGMTVEAGAELKRRETSYLRRNRSGAAFATLMGRYHRADNYNRPWMLAIMHGGRAALNAKPKRRAGVWWRHAYPLAYQRMVERWRHLGKNPKYYLYAIMRRESGFDRHILSYADAIGLLQMIPPTTKRVVKELGLEYSRDLLYDPETNIKTASWYIGHLLEKFRGQLPIGSASYNCGPKPVMRWLKKNGKRPMDEYVELIPYRQTREYGKMVTEDYARYLYLYGSEIYEQPLNINADFVVDDLTY